MKMLFHGSTPLGFLLAAVVGLTAWLGYESFGMAVSERRMAQTVLEDYAAIAAAEYADQAVIQLHHMLDHVFLPVAQAERYGALPPTFVQSSIQTFVRGHDCCTALGSPAYAFKLMVDGSLQVVPDTVSEATRARVQGLFAGMERAGPRATRVGLMTSPAGGLSDQPTMIGYAVSDSEEGLPEPTWGFVVSMGAVDELLVRAYERGELLPPSIAKGGTNDSLANIAVRDRSGSEVFRSDESFFAESNARDSVSVLYGGFVVDAAIKPAGVAVLTGGLPESRLPLLGSLLLLTLGIGVLAFLQLCRERGFQKSRETFVSSVSHELRTPLSQILLFSELQQSGRLRSDEQRTRAMGIIVREARRLTHLVDNVLEFSGFRETSGRETEPKETVDLESVVAEGLESVGLLFESRAVNLDVRLEPGLHAQVHRQSLTRIVVNLLDNAIKYGPPGQTISVRLRRVEDQARLEVTDQGPGIPERDRDRIWNAYERLPRDANGQIQGSGIGLSVVRELVTRDGGRSWVEEDADGGACFVVEFPLAEATRPAEIRVQPLEATPA